MRSAAFFLSGFLIAAGLSCWIVSWALAGPQNRLDVGGYGLFAWGSVIAAWLVGQSSEW